MVALISPLPYSADFRPYFTIHDPAFTALAAGEVPSNANGHPRLLGITNLYFLKVPATCPVHRRLARFCCLTLLPQALPAAQQRLHPLGAAGHPRPSCAVLTALAHQRCPAYSPICTRRLLAMAPCIKGIDPTRFHPRLAPEPRLQDCQRPRCLC